MEWFLIGASIGTICGLIYWLCSDNKEDEDRLKREEFAKAAMQVLCANYLREGVTGWDIETYAEEAVALADSLINALNKDT